jgi:hypothetical protein
MSWNGTTSAFTAISQRSSDAIFSYRRPYHIADCGILGSSPLASSCTLGQHLFGYSGDKKARSQYDLSPAFLLMAAAAVSFVTTVGLRETYKLALSGPHVLAEAA